jgi:hypothetical protein
MRGVPDGNELKFDVLRIKAFPTLHLTFPKESLLLLQREPLAYRFCVLRHTFGIGVY